MTTQHTPTDELVRVTAQRDALLTTLREAEATLSNAQEHFSLNDTLTIVRAAIAAATEGNTP